jgi:hypothetical protein
MEKLNSESKNAARQNKFEKLLYIYDRKLFTDFTTLLQLSDVFVEDSSVLFNIKIYSFGVKD